MGSHPRRDGQRSNDVPRAAPGTAHAQKKTTVVRERNEAARAAWREDVAALDPADLVFVDETSTPVTLTPLRARALRGERAVDRVPRARWRSVTLLATLTPTGMGPCALLAGATDRLAFEAFVEQLLIPALRPGQTVVLDNLAVHKSARARERLAAAGCAVCFLPTYSPDFNPIEQAFAKLKTSVRRAEARIYDDLLVAADLGIAAITAQDAAAFFADAGFPLTDQLL